MRSAPRHEGERRADRTVPPPLTRDALRRAAQGYDFDVGEGTYGVPSVFWFGEDARLEIGRYCSIAPDVTIMLGGNHRPDWVTTYPFNRMNPAAAHLTGHPATKGSVRIGHDVWLGHRCRIMSGVTIGNGACVATDAVVSRDVPPYAIVGGVPASVIRLRFASDQIEALQRIAWWHWPSERIDAFLPLLLSPDISAFIEAAQAEWT